MTPKTKIEALPAVAYLHTMTTRKGAVTGTIVLGYELKPGAKYKWPNGEMATVISADELISKKDALHQLRDHT